MSMVNDTSAPTLTRPPKVEVSRRQMINASLASLLGWSLDLFDLFVLLYVAPVIGQLFFRPIFLRSHWPPSMLPLPSHS